jgi:predicted lactoylglutathione lyase
MSMAGRIFVNLPVTDLTKSMDFFKSLGFAFNPQFTDDKAGCMVVSDTIFVMLLRREYFATFTPKPVADARKSTEVLVALSCDSRKDVDDLVSKATTAGGSTYAEPKDHGFMYQHGFQDPDGHIWEIFWMDPATLQQD